MAVQPSALPASIISNHARTNMLGPCRFFQYVLLALVGILNLQATTCAQQPEHGSKARLKQFLSVAEELREKLRVPGVGIGIVNQNQVIFAGGLGDSDVKKSIPVTEKTLFAIGSNTKAFTGLLVAQLVAEKKLSWSTPVKSYIPDLKLSDPYVQRHVTLADLGSHMSGVSRHDDWWKGKPLSREQVYQQVSRLPFDASLRKQFNYNNHMYLVVAKAIENTSGKSWEDNIKARIFKPLKMTDSTVSYREFMDHTNRSIGYAADGETIETHLNVDNIGPAGSIGSTPEDLSKWLLMWVQHAHISNRPFLAIDEYRRYAMPNSATMVGPNEFKSYWAGWGEKIVSGEVQLIHSGGIDGFSSRIVARPFDQFGIFILTNQRSDYKELLIDYAQQIFIDGELQRDQDRESQLGTK